MSLRRRSSSQFRSANCPGASPSDRIETLRRNVAPHAAKSSGSDLALLVAGILAGPFRGGPFRMVADPLRDVGLRAHHALIDRSLPGELQIFFFAIRGVGDSANRQDYLDHSDALCPNNGIRSGYAALAFKSCVQSQFRFSLWCIVTCP